MPSEPTADQVRTYLELTGWRIEAEGAVAARWTKGGAAIRIDHGDYGSYGTKVLLAQIADAEHREPAGVRSDILDMADAEGLRIGYHVLADTCTRASIAVGRHLEVLADGGPADAAIEQATALAAALVWTGIAMRDAMAADPMPPMHPLWIATARAAEAITRAEPAKPDDLEEIRRRLAAARIEGREKEH